ncbi:MFS transporter [Leucobacter sp. UCMA 4100]|uniref:peptide MFS transporter n=1 Tax=Leucobacter sp. UCMA 4100 TaxID=2810534 RepID=UPI0022EA9B80|nr:oligopeptide:H+ symporter [Leucobacter sp. UCMA 4100]MDA3146851.1 MFS transporter [Leucobacter sp. UCMA 4100]
MTKPLPDDQPSQGLVKPAAEQSTGVTRALGVVVEDAKPSGLITLSGVEMWERFSFYGLQVLLAYYLYYSMGEGGLGLPQPVALGIAGSYGGLVYIAQIVGAWIADRVLAPKYVVLIGGSSILAGHIMLAIVPGLAGLVIGLALIVIGTGGLKVNTTMMVGELYPNGGARRDAGYSIYYMGITIGAFAGPLITGWLHQSWGFHAAFFAAAIGMAAGLTQYVFGMGRLPASTATVPNPLPKADRTKWIIIAVAIVAAIALGVVFGVIRAENISNVVALVVLVAAIGLFAMLFTNRKVTTAERRGVVRYIPVFLMSLVFWTLLFQLFTAFAVFADTKINLTIGSFTMPPTLIVTLESLAVAAITALLAVLWTKSRAARMTPVTKLVIGVIAMSFGAAFIVPFSLGEGTSMPLVIALLVMIFFAFGESLFAPSALSFTAELAPKAVNSQMTALYFLTMAGGSTFSGWISQSYREGAEAQYFTTVAIVSLAAIVVLGVVYRVVDRAMGRRETV